MHVDIKSIDLPTFRTGETGPLLGRVVLKVTVPSVATVQARAFVTFDGQKAGRTSSGAKTIYTGLSSTLDFPLELAAPRDENTFLAGQLHIEVGSEGFWAEPVHLYVRRHGAFFRTYRSTLDDTVYPYALYLPEGVGTETRAWPLVLSLHGAYSNHALNLRRVMGRGNRPGEPDELSLESLPIFPGLPKVEAIVVCPWGRGTMGYHGPGARDALDVLDDVTTAYPVDFERVSITGLSMGGNGTWELALHHTDLFTAAVPVCAPLHFNLGQARAFDDENEAQWPFLKQLHRQNDIINYARNAAPLRIRIHHGTDDPVVPFSHSRDMYDILTGIGIPTAIVPYDSVGHNSWDSTYKDAWLLNWLISHRREHPLREVRFVAGRYAQAKRQWVEVTRFETYGQLAKVQAVYDERAATVTLKTANVARLALDLARLPGLNAGKTVKVSPAGTEPLEVVVPDGGPASLEIHADEVTLVRDADDRDTLVKRKGLEGPICDVLSSRVILVYGTQGRDVGKTLAQLKRFADWGELPDHHFIIKPDRDVTEADIQQCNLVLFGDPGNNALIERINAMFPVRFDEDHVVVGRDRYRASDVAFKCVYPNPLNPDKLVLWNYAEGWDYTAFFFYRNCLQWLPDYIVYRRGANYPFKADILKAGFFDDRWHMD